MIAACAGLSPAPRQVSPGTWVSSGTETVCLEKAPIIIGERINPTGKKKMKEALRDGDVNYLLKEAVAQSMAGAHVLDVNVGLPQIDEPAWM